MCPSLSPRLNHCHNHVKDGDMTGEPKGYCNCKNLSSQKIHNFLDSHSSQARFLCNGLIQLVQWCKIGSQAYFTFRHWRDLEGDADDSLKILNGDERPQNGSDADSFSFASLNQLDNNWEQIIFIFQSFTAYIGLLMGIIHSDTLTNTYHYVYILYYIVSSV